MFLVDDILLSPMKGLYAIIRELHEAAKQEHANEAQSLRTQLSDLYMQLETRQITDEEFDEQERTLLDRLDALEGEMDQEAEDALDEEEDEQEDEDDEDDEDDEEEGTGEAFDEESPADEQEGVHAGTDSDPVAH